MPQAWVATDSPPFEQAGGFAYAEEPWSDCGTADKVLPLAALAAELAHLGERLRRGDGSPFPGHANAAARAEAAVGHAGTDRSGTVAARKIVALLRNTTGVDFSQCKPSTIGRRILRRAVLNHKAGLEEYARFLRGNAKELAALHDDLMSGATGFFRGPEAIERRKQAVGHSLPAGAASLPLAERMSAQLAAIVSSSHDAIISKDLEGIIQTWNEGATELFGYTAEEAIGQPTTMLMPPDRVNEEPGILKRIKAGEVIDQYQAVRQHKDGHLLHILLTISPIRNEKGEIIGASKMARDIGAELAAMRAMRISEQRYTDLFTTMDQGFCVIELVYDAQDKLIDWTYVEANPAFEKHSGMVNVVGKRATEFLPNLEPHWLELYDKVYQSGVGARCINAVSDVNRWMEVYTYPTGHAAQRQLAVLFADVTERVRAERHMRKVAESLQREDRHKNQFLATLAHELRNPLAPLRSGLEVLQDEGRGGEVAGMMQRQVDQIVRLVDDLLDVSRLGTGKITLRKEPVLLARIISEAAEAMAPVLREQGQKLLLTPPPASVHVEGDPARLTQVLSNLINNACKFSDDGNLIELSTALHDGMAVIEVKDQGYGISPDELPRIFGLFNQAPAPAKLRNNAGLGIGLTLVRDLVQMHAGTVEAHSEGLGKGSTFTVKLPVMAEAPPAVSSNGKAPAPQVEGRKVLVVDDNLDAAQLLSMVLGRKGFQVRTAADGPSGIAAAEDFRPEVILLDIGLPGMSGYEVAERLRAREWAKGVLLVALTGWGQNEDREKSRQAGFDHHLVKPVQVGRILELMKEMAG